MKFYYKLINHSKETNERSLDPSLAADWIQVLSKRWKRNWPVKIAQPAAAASEILWPAEPGRNEPPITAIGVSL